MLAIVILLEVPDMRMTINAKAVSLPTENRGGMTETAFDEWEEKQTEMLNAAETLGEFTANGSVPVLSGTQDDNRIWSPVNAYIALSMTAEMTGEEQQEDILAVLGRENMDSLRESLKDLTPEQAKQLLDRAGEEKSREIYDLIRKKGR